MILDLTSNASKLKGEEKGDVEDLDFTSIITEESERLLPKDLLRETLSQDDEGEGIDKFEKTFRPEYIKTLEKINSFEGNEKNYNILKLKGINYKVISTNLPKHIEDISYRVKHFHDDDGKVALSSEAADLASGEEDNKVIFTINGDREPRVSFDLFNPKNAYS